LLVEDDRDDARLVVDLLGDAKRARFIVDVAETALMGLEKIKKNRYDVALLDYRLPDKTGMELMQEFEALHFRIPVILITSHGDRRLQEKALDAGVAEFLEKGTYNAQILERTCLYAIGLHDRQESGDASAGGVSMLVQELISLTREGVTAQINSASQIAELRGDIRDEIGSLRKDLQVDVIRLETKVMELQAHSDKQKEDIIKSFSKTPLDRIQAAVGWMVLHPVASIVMFMAVVTIVVLMALLLQAVDPKNVKALKDAVGAMEILDVPLILTSGA
jgi:DNA-binding response OmpR family regulator